MHKNSITIKLDKIKTKEGEIKNENKKIEKVIDNLKHKIECKIKILENSKKFMKFIQKTCTKTKLEESTELAKTIEKLKLENYWSSIFFSIWKKVVKQNTQIFKLQQQNYERNLKILR